MGICMGVAWCCPHPPRQLTTVTSPLFRLSFPPIYLTRPILLSSRLRQSTLKESWRTLGRTTRRLHLWIFIPSCMFDAPHCLRCRPLTRCSPQDALRSFSQPTKDPRLEFYTMYGREAAKYDTDYTKKYDEDLSTTLIFVRPSSFSLVKYLTCSHRRVCPLPSAPLL